MKSGIVHAPKFVKTLRLFAADGVLVEIEKPLCGARGWRLLLAYRTEKVTCLRCRRMLKLRGKL